MTGQPLPSGQRPDTLGDLLLGFSAVTSAGLGLQTDHGVRTCYLAMCMAADLELSPERSADVYYAALAKDGGCTCGASQMAAFLGSDEREAISDLVQRDADNELDMLRWLFRHAGRGAGPATRARRTLDALIHGARFEHAVSVAECEVAQRIAIRLGLAEEAALALTACNERWDGKGQPGGRAGEAIPLVSRIINLSAAVEIGDRFSGRDAAIALVRRRSGGAFDPALAEVFLQIAQREDFWAAFEDEDLLQRLRTMEPRRGTMSASADVVDHFAEVLADMVELKRPATAGHARRVAELARRLGARLGLPVAEQATLWRAALLHDLGLVAVSARDLDRGDGGVVYRAHPLTPAQLLGDVRSLREACELAALHHERVDGSGWPVGASAARQPLAARILATVCALDEQPAPVPPAEAIRLLAAQPGLDREVLDALAAELGARRAPRPGWPAGLTDREVEVLRLGSAGLSVREIGQRLVISHHTARHHLEAAYAKIGCSTRAAAALFAAEHGLLN